MKENNIGNLRAGGEKGDRHAPFEIGGEAPQESKPVTALTVPERGAKDETFRFSEIFRGSSIGREFLRRNWGAIVLILVLVIIYVSNRYLADQEVIQISDLQRELEDVRYRALTHSSELTMRCRQSFVERALRNAGDTTLRVRKDPPFVIKRDR